MPLPVELQPLNIMGAYPYYSKFDDPLAAFFEPLDSPFGGNHVSYDVYKYPRLLGQVVPYGAKAPVRDMPVRSHVVLDPPTVKGKIPFDQQFLNNARDLGALEANGQAEIQRGLTSLRLEIARTQGFFRAQMLTAGALLKSDGTLGNTVQDGKVYYYQDGFATTSPGYIQPGYNTSQLYTHAPGAASWATHDTNIQADLDELRTIAEINSGISSDWCVLMNRNTYTTTIAKNDKVVAMAGIWGAEQIQQYGYIKDLWGYQFQIVNTSFVPDSRLFSVTGSTVLPESGIATVPSAAVKYIPDNCVVLLPVPAANVECGRHMIACQPSDRNAPESARGFYAWEDEDWEHPHNVSIGYETTEWPIMQNPDSLCVILNVTATS